MLNKALIIFKDSILNSDKGFISRSTLTNLIELYDCGYKRIYIIDEAVGTDSNSCSSCEKELKTQENKMLINIIQSITRGEIIKDSLFGIIYIDNNVFPYSPYAMPSPLIYSQLELTYGVDLDNSMVIGNTTAQEASALEFGLNYITTNELRTQCVIC